MKVFVSGGAGFLGSWLVEGLLKSGHTVIAVDSLIGGYRENFFEAGTIGPNYSWFVSDVTELDKMSELMDGCDVVYHTAALAYEGLSVFSPTLVTNNIVTGSTAMMTAAIRNNIKRFVNCSSMARYGSQPVPFRETMPADPEDPYGIAKVAAEMQLNLLGKTHGVDVVHAVPHNIIGPRQKYDDPFRNVASIMINLMLQGRQPIIYGDGEQVRCFSFVDDVLQVLTKLIDCDLREHGEKFNVGPDEEPVTINELAHRIARLLDFDLEIEYHDPRPCEVRLATSSADKIRERFGYQTAMTLDEGLMTIIDYVKTKGVKPFDYHLPIEIETAQLPRSWKDRLF